MMIRNPHPAALREVRERRGWTQEQMADEMAVLPLEVAAWEAGRVRLTKKQARHMRALAAEDFAHAALLAAALPACAWADESAPGLHEWIVRHPSSVGQLKGSTQAHVGYCPDCRRVRSFRRKLRVRLDQGFGFEPAEALERYLAETPLLMGATGVVTAASAVVFAWRVLHDVLPGPDWNVMRAGSVGVAAFLAVSGLLEDRLRHLPYLSGIFRGTVGAACGLLASAMISGSYGVELVPIAGWTVLGLGVGHLVGRWRMWRLKRESEAAAAEKLKPEFTLALGVHSDGVESIRTVLGSAPGATESGE